MSIEAIKLALEALEGFIPYLPLHDKKQCDRYDKAITALRQALEQAQQAKPVAWMNGRGDVFKNPDDAERGQTLIPLYTTPPQRKPLTDEEIDSIAALFYTRWQGNEGFARAIEAAHGIKE